MTAAPDVVVVGGGVVGCAVAFALARERIRVRLLEAEDVACGASGAAAGMLTPVGEASDPDSPLLRLGIESLSRFPGWVEAVREHSGLDPELERSGLLRVALDPGDAEALASRPAAIPELGLEWLGPEDAHRLEPSLTPDTPGALWSPRDGHVRPPLFSRALARAAAALGADVRTGVRVTGLRRAGARVIGVEAAGEAHAAGHVVLCTGHAAAGLPAWLDRAGALAIEPVRGQILSLLPTARGPRTIVWGGSTYLVPKRDGTLVVGATEERVGADRRVTAAGLRSLLTAAPRLVPGLADAAFLGAWAGLRPGTPDRLPLVGPWPGCDGLLLAAGHHRSGVLLSPLTAEWVRDLVLGKALPAAAAAVAPERLAPVPAGLPG